MSGKMRDLIGLISPSWRGAQKCEACGEDFVCGAALTGCWCTEIKLSAEVRAKLRQSYQHCLCRACLEKEVLSAEC
jgi:hypothetical protein